MGLIPPKSGAAEWDNGVFLIGKGWEIVGRREFEGEEQDNYELLDMLLHINEAQPIPINKQIVKAFVKEELEPKSYEEKISNLSIGDNVAVWLHNGWDIRSILGFGEDGKIVNGSDVSGLPYFDFFESSLPIENNPNSYLHSYDRFYILEDSQ